MGPGTASFHFFSKGKHLPKVFFKLVSRDECALPTLRVSNTLVAEGLKRLPRRHAAHAQPLGNDLFGGKWPPWFKTSRTNLLEELLLNLEVERDDTLPVEIKRVHFDSPVV